MSKIKSDDSDITIDASGSGRDIKFQANGVEKASIDSTGNLTVSGSVTATGSINIDHSGSDTFATIVSPKNRDLRIDLDANDDNDGFIVRDLRNNSERFVVNAVGNVGIGTSSPSSQFEVKAPTVNNHPKISSTSSGGITSSFFQQRTGAGTATIFERSDAGTVMQFDSSGNVGVGTTSLLPGVGNTATGHALYNDGRHFLSKSGNTVMSVNRNTNDGGLIELRKDGSTVGVIGAYGGDLYIRAKGNNGVRLLDAANSFIPSNNVGGYLDNVMDLGYSTARWDDVRATNGTIQTSDRNEKQDIEELTATEERVAVACKSLMRKFRWKSAFEAKGDDARIHFGIIAQDLQDAFAAEGLDAGRYAMFISDTWYEKEVEVPAVEAVEEQEATYDEDGNELKPYVEGVEAKDAYTRTDTEDEPTEGYTERTRLGVRYPELLAFIISAI